MIVESVTEEGKTYTLVDEDEAVAVMTLHESGLILSIDVTEGMGRRGYATRLYEEVVALRPVYHVPDWGRTPEGDAWARAVGGDVMDDEQAAAIVGMDLSIYEID